MYDVPAPGVSVDEIRPISVDARRISALIAAAVVVVLAVALFRRRRRVRLALGVLLFLRGLRAATR